MNATGLKIFNLAMLVLLLSACQPQELTDLESNQTKWKAHNINNYEMFFEQNECGSSAPNCYLRIHSVRVVDNKVTRVGVNNQRLAESEFGDFYTIDTLLSAIKTDLASNRLRTTTYDAELGYPLQSKSKVANAQSFVGFRVSNFNRLTATDKWLSNIKFWYALETSSTTLTYDLNYTSTVNNGTPEKVTVKVVNKLVTNVTVNGQASTANKGKTVKQLLEIFEAGLKTADIRSVTYLTYPGEPVSRIKYVVPKAFALTENKDTPNVNVSYTDIGFTLIKE